MPSEVSVGNILFISIIGPHWNAETVTVPYPSISASFQVSLPHPRTSNNLCTLVNTHNSMHDFEIETSIKVLGFSASGFEKCFSRWKASLSSTE